MKWWARRRPGGVQIRFELNDDFPMWGSRGHISSCGCKTASLSANVGFASFGGTKQTRSSLPRVGRGISPRQFEREAANRIETIDSQSVLHESMHQIRSPCSASDGTMLSLWEAIADLSYCWDISSHAACVSFSIQDKNFLNRQKAGWLSRRLVEVKRVVGSAYARHRTPCSLNDTRNCGDFTVPLLLQNGNKIFDFTKESFKKDCIYKNMCWRIKPFISAQRSRCCLARPEQRKCVARPQDVERAHIEHETPALISQRGMQFWNLFSTGYLFVTYSLSCAVNAATSIVLPEPSRCQQLCSTPDTTVHSFLLHAEIHTTTSILLPEMKIVRQGLTHVQSRIE